MLKLMLQSSFLSVSYIYITASMPPSLPARITSNLDLQRGLFRACLRYVFTFTCHTVNSAAFSKETFFIFHSSRGIPRITHLQKPVLTNFAELHLTPIAFLSLSSSAFGTFIFCSQYHRRSKKLWEMALQHIGTEP